MNPSTFDELIKEYFFLESQIQSARDNSSHAERDGSFYRMNLQNDPLSVTQMEPIYETSELKQSFLIKIPELEYKQAQLKIPILHAMQLVQPKHLEYVAKIQVNTHTYDTTYDIWAVGDVINIQPKTNSTPA